MKAIWSKLRERYNASVLVMFGIPTLLRGGGCIGYCTCSRIPGRSA